jgi:hypothetical protein
MYVSMKIYLWTLHIGGFALAFALGFDAERGTWPASILCALTSVVAIALIVATKFAESGNRRS